MYHIRIVNSDGDSVKQNQEEMIALFARQRQLLQLMIENALDMDIIPREMRLALASMTDLDTQKHIVRHNMCWNSKK